MNRLYRRFTYFAASCTFAFGAAISGIAGGAEPSVQQQSQSPPRSIEPPTNGCLTPDYPFLAWRTVATGVTRVVFTVGPSGVPTDIAVVRHSGNSFGHRKLDEAAVAAIAKCNFGEAYGYKPARAVQDFVWQVNDPPAVPLDNQVRPQ